MRLNHPETITTPCPGPVEKLSSMKPVPGAKNVGDRCDKGLNPNYIKNSYNLISETKQFD